MTCFMELASMKDRISSLERDTRDILVSLDAPSWRILEIDTEMCERLQYLFGWQLEDLHTLRTCRDHQVPCVD
ncbi:hypothetical protein F5B22DRAFT_622156 [Xylaria bambusicola]|uniref:uncharacterized protein n=1 Tax=Xylaria bambusicola TaxID=326684 RepID=UPI002008BEB2|nr:uncharacterized protein F5B22DRAFT_622156 [Xylaria bambusicola]KAI0506814.1 hypothetical protein F5B22DRAFT_622156 [Xylaria bambusicola]